MEPDNSSEPVTLIKIQIDEETEESDTFFGSNTEMGSTFFIVGSSEHVRRCLDRVVSNHTGVEAFYAPNRNIIIAFVQSGMLKEIREFISALGKCVGELDLNFLSPQDDLAECSALYREALKNYRTVGVESGDQRILTEINRYVGTANVDMLCFDIDFDDPTELGELFVGLFRSLMSARVTKVLINADACDFIDDSIVYRGLIPLLEKDEIREFSLCYCPSGPKTFDKCFTSKKTTDDFLTVLYRTERLVKINIFSAEYKK